MKNTIRRLGVSRRPPAVRGRSASPRRAQGTVREFTIRGDQFAFHPRRIEVQKDDIVKITFTAVDMPHSFTLDDVPDRQARQRRADGDLRVPRRPAAPRFYCNLTQDDRCKGMHGEIIVK